jgi:hypothetical protein
MAMAPQEAVENGHDQHATAATTDQLPPAFSATTRLLHRQDLGTDSVPEAQDDAPPAADLA